MGKIGNALANIEAETLNIIKHFHERHHFFGVAKEATGQRSDIFEFHYANAHEATMVAGIFKAIGLGVEYTEGSDKIVFLLLMDRNFSLDRANKYIKKLIQEKEEELKKQGISSFRDRMVSNRSDREAIAHWLLENKYDVRVKTRTSNGKRSEKCIPIEVKAEEDILNICKSLSKDLNFYVIQRTKNVMVIPGSAEHDDLVRRIFNAHARKTLKDVSKKVEGDFFLNNTFFKKTEGAFSCTVSCDSNAIARKVAKTLQAMRIKVTSPNAPKVTGKSVQFEPVVENPTDILLALKEGEAIIPEAPPGPLRTTHPGSPRHKDLQDEGKKREAKGSEQKNQGADDSSKSSVQLEFSEAQLLSIIAQVDPKKVLKLLKAKGSNGTLDLHKAVEELTSLGLTVVDNDEPFAMKGKDVAPKAVSKERLEKLLRQKPKD